MSSATFWNRHAAKYAKSPIPNEAVYEQKLAMTQEYFTQESVVLEIGCGTGTTALHHAPFVKHIDAWDISDKMLDIARAKQQTKGIENIDFQCAPTEQLSLPAQHYDVAMAHSLLHLLNDKEATMRAVHRALKPGGIFVSSTACLGNSMNWLKIITRPMQLLGFWPDVSFFSSRELEQSIIECGFEIEESWLPPKAIAHFFIARKVGE